MSHHNRTRQPSEDDEEDDPLDRILKKSGCADLHYKVQFCMAEKQDWRQCQLEVKEFRECVERNKTKPAEKTWVRGTGPYPRQLRLVDSRHPRTIRTRVVAGSSPSKQSWTWSMWTYFVHCLLWSIDLYFTFENIFFITFMKSLMHICVNFFNGQGLIFKE